MVVVVVATATRGNDFLQERGQDGSGSPGSPLHLQASSGGSIGLFQRRMEIFFQRLGFFSGVEWVYYPLTGPTTESGGSGVLWVPGSEVSCGESYKGLAREEGSDTSISRCGGWWCYIPLDFSQEKIRSTQTVLGSSICKPVYSSSKISTGRSESSPQSDQTKRLHVQDRFERWLLAGTDCASLTQIFTIPVEWTVLSFSLFTFWIVYCPVGFYKDIKTYYSLLSSKWNTHYLLFRRYTYFVFFISWLHEEGFICQGFIGVCWVDYQFREIDPDPGGADGIFGGYGRLQKDDVLCSCREEDKISKVLRSHPQKGIQFYYQIENSSSSSRQASESLPLRPFYIIAPAGADADNKIPHRGKRSRVRFLEPGDKGFVRSSRGVGLVDRLASRVEGKVHHNSRSRSGFVFRREQHWLRGSDATCGVQGKKGGTGLLVAGRTSNVNQFSRAGRSSAGSTEFRQVEKVTKLFRSSLYRQYCRIRLSHEDGGQIRSLAIGSNTSAAFLRTKANLPHGRARPGNLQRVGRSTVKSSYGSERLVSQSKNFSKAKSYLGPIYYRLVCHAQQHPVAPFRYINFGRQSYFHRRTSAFEGGGEWVRQSAVCGDREVASEAKGNVKVSHAGSPRLAQPAMVAGSVISTRRHASIATRYTGSLCSTSAGSSQLCDTSAAMAGPGMQAFWEILQAYGISQEAAKIMYARWARSTVQNYAYIWDRWKAFAFDSGGDPFHPGLPLVVDFLVSEFRRNNTASALNHAVSALGGILQFTGEKHLLSSPFVLSLRKGANVLVPPGPALESTWDIYLVLKFLKEMGNNAMLSLEDLLFKTTVLLRIDLLARPSDLVKLFREQIKFDNGFFSCRLLRPKEWRSASQNSFRKWSSWIVVYEYPQDTDLCTYTVLKLWMESTRFVKRVHVDGKLREPLLCVPTGSNKGRALSAKDISTISKTFMDQAGVLASFPAKSMRSAVCSALMDYGVPVKLILQQGRWASTSAGMVKQYYYRKIKRRPGSWKKNSNIQVAIRSCL